MPSNSILTVSKTELKKTVTTKTIMIYIQYKLYIPYKIIYHEPFFLVFCYNRMLQNYLAHFMFQTWSQSFFKVLVTFCISTSSMRGPLALHPLQYLVVTLNFFAILVNIYWYLNVILSCLSLIKITESLASYVFSFMKYVAPNLLARNVACRSSLSIVNVSPLCLVGSWQTV